MNFGGYKKKPNQIHVAIKEFFSQCVYAGTHTNNSGDPFYGKSNWKWNVLKYMWPNTNIFFWIDIDATGGLQFVKAIAKRNNPIIITRMIVADAFCIWFVPFLVSMTQCHFTLSKPKTTQMKSFIIQIICHFRLNDRSLRQQTSTHTFKWVRSGEISRTKNISEFEPVSRIHRISNTLHPNKQWLSASFACTHTQCSSSLLFYFWAWIKLLLRSLLLFVAEISL